MLSDTKILLIFVTNFFYIPKQHSLPICCIILTKYNYELKCTYYQNYLCECSFHYYSDLLMVL